MVKNGFSPLTYIALAGVEGELGQSWFQHGPNMSLAWSQKVGTQYRSSLRPYWPNISNFRALFVLDL